MVYSLFCARALLAECSNKQDIIISYGDILYQQTILKKLLQSNEGDIQVCADQNWFAYWSMRMSDPLSDVENFSIAPTGFLKNIGGKPANLSEVQGQYMGLFKISKNFIGKFIESYDALSHAQIDHQKLSMTDFLQLLISAGCQIFPLLFNGGWLELDTAQEYEMYQCLDAQKTLNQFYDHVL
jgi:choline kinase